MCVLDKKPLYSINLNGKFPCCLLDEGHATRVGTLSYSIASKMGYGFAVAEQLWLAGYYHDIGKIFVPENIVSKPGQLTEKEKEIMRKHTQYGHDLLQNEKTALCDLLAQVALDHHERLDGTGYQGKCKKEISDAAKIVMVADVFDALTSDRCYKNAYSREQATLMMKNDAGIKLEKQYVDALCEIVFSPQQGLDFCYSFMQTQHSG